MVGSPLPPPQTRSCTVWASRPHWTVVNTTQIASSNPEKERLVCRFTNVGISSEYVGTRAEIEDEMRRGHLGDKSSTS
jgi:hypothetical protein